VQGLQAGAGLSAPTAYDLYLVELGRREAPPQSTEGRRADDSLESKVGARVLPRNKQARELSESVRKEIQALLERHPATAPVLTAKSIQPHLSRRLSLRAIRWHVQAIRKPA
jgi:hypothetical protein